MASLGSPSRPGLCAASRVSSRMLKSPKCAWFVNAAMLAIAAGSALAQMRAPAVPLMVANPFLSVWSRTDKLTDSFPSHWSGTSMGMAGMIMVDNKPYRWCGTAPADVPAAVQKSVKVEALSTRYTFEAGGVEFEVSFVTPAIASDPEYCSWAGSIVYLGAHNADSQPHTLSFYLDISGEWCTHTPDQPVNWSRAKGESVHLLSMGVEKAQVLARTGDATRLDWGRVYLAAKDQYGVATLVARHDKARSEFARHGVLVGADDLEQPRAADDRWPVLAAVQQFGRMEPGQHFETKFIIAQDEGRCVEYFERPLKPYWTIGGGTFSEILSEFFRDDHDLVESVKAANARIHARSLAAGGEAYAAMCDLAYRQTMGAHIIAADADGTMLMFPKENTSNGCIGTVDVFFPSAPFFLAENPQMLAAQVRPLLAYGSMTHRWKFPFAPHDLGIYPKANGQVYGGREQSEVNQMPVEESANMIILVEALRQARGGQGGGLALAEAHWPVITKWAGYLKEHGLDPANQLCTDDFAGHLARNANLSVKAIIALGCYANLCEQVESPAAAKPWRDTARQYAAQWLTMADDGDHTVLAFGKPGTWSLKYNLIWDQILELGLFEPSVRAREVAHYFRKMNRFGPPLDSRKDYTKLDFAAWAGAMAVSREEFERFMKPICDMPGATPDRVGLTDWYQTTDARTMGMHSRSVVGGIWARQLLDGEWKRGTVLIPNPE